MWSLQTYHGGEHRADHGVLGDAHSIGGGRAGGGVGVNVAHGDHHILRGGVGGTSAVRGGDDEHVRGQHLAGQRALQVQLARACIQPERAACKQQV